MLASADHAVELVALFVARSGDTLVGVDAFKYPSVLRLDSFGVVLDLSFVTQQINFSTDLINITSLMTLMRNEKKQRIFM